MRSIDTLNLERSPDELFGFAPLCRLPCQEDANENRLAAAAVVSARSADSSCGGVVWHSARPVTPVMWRPFRKWRQINHRRERRMTCRVISAPEGS